MRRFLFRGISEYTGEWVYGYLIHGKEGGQKHAYPGYYILKDNFVADRNIKEVLYFCMHKVKEDTVGQYSGLQTQFPHKTRTELYEGDIVEFLYLPELQTIRGVVNFKNGKFVAEWKRIMLAGDWILPKEIYDREMESDLCGSSSYKILGNIHENPELLSEEKEG